MAKYVYTFGGGSAEGTASDKNLLGGKGANLAEMCSLGIPVPAGFTISTECCTAYYAAGCKLPAELTDQVLAALKKTETIMGMKYGDAVNPLLISCRSGARSSMPGMMDTVLNIGLSTATIPGMIAKTGNPRFVWDSYRRLIMMYADVVMEKAEGLEPALGKGIRKILDEKLDALKRAKGCASDTDLGADDLKTLAEEFKALVAKHLGKPFPDDPMAQLWGGIAAVFKSWNGKKAVSYRRIEGIPDDWGTAVNVQAMVFGNMGDSSATGVAFTRDPATGDNKFYGEWLVNAQGEDVVAGIRTPSPINDDTKNEQNRHLVSMQHAMPEIYRELDAIRTTLEKHFTDMLDIEFTIQEGKLWMLQCRVGKRTGTAALNMALDMLAEGLIDEATAVMRVQPKQLEELLYPIIDPKTEKDANPIVKGLPAGPGAACGALVFTAEDAVASHRAGRPCILLREETNPEDVEGMRAAVGILTARGGMTSHAALVARGWGKCCIVGAGALHVDAKTRTAKIAGSDLVLKEGDIVTLNGTKGHVYVGSLPMMDATENPRFQRVHDHGRHLPDDGRAHQRRHAGGCQGRPRLRRRGHRPGPHRAHVLRRGLRPAALLPAQDDPEQDRRGAHGRPERTLPVRQGVAERHAGGDGRSAGDHPPPRPAAARVRAAGRREAGRTGPGAGHRGGGRQEARRGPARDKPDDGSPRRPPRHHLSRGERDADPRHLREQPPSCSRPARSASRRSWCR